MRQEMRQEQRLTISQKLALKQLLAIGQKLKDLEFPNPTKGLEGMRIANQMLQARQSVGLLIGGLAEEVWRTKDPKHLERHKDVDVLVFNDEFKINHDFEEGIDWWLPQNDTIRTHDIGGISDNIPVRYWLNGNNVVLSYGAVLHEELEPGLYIPGKDCAADMRIEAILANVDRARLEGDLDEDAIESFVDKTRKKLKNELMPTIGREFKSQILEASYQNTFKEKPVEIFGSSLPILRGIRRVLMARQN